METTMWEAPMDDEEARGMAQELAEILDGIQQELDRAISLAGELSEETDVQVLSSIEVVQFGVKSAIRELPDPA